jgi:hypothetical protein
MVLEFFLSSVFLQARPEPGKMVLDYFLIGIMIELRKYKYYILVGNKIKPIMRDLEEKRVIRI